MLTREQVIEAVDIYTESIKQFDTKKQYRTFTKQVDRFLKSLSPINRALLGELFRKGFEEVIGYVPTSNSKQSHGSIIHVHRFAFYYLIKQPANLELALEYANN